MPLASPTILTVNTRRGPVRFETQLEWDEAIALCRQEAIKGSKFASDLVAREDKKLFMSESQVCWVYKIAEDLRKVSEPKKPQRSIDASNILASVAEARAKGVKKPMLRFVDPVGNAINVKYMSMGKNAGGCWVTSNGDLIGKIDDTGAFTFTGAPYTDKFKAEVFDFIEITNHDVKHAVQSYGKLTSNCACCGRTLTNPESIRLNVGPICLEKYGF